METLDVVVVGAGISGLTAAWRLQQAGCSVRVLEANARVGGRTLNHQFAAGDVVEVGGQWVGPTQDRVLALDFIYVVGMLMMLVLAVRYDSAMYFEGALLMVLLGFVSSMALAKFLLRGEVV